MSRLAPFALALTSGMFCSQVVVQPRYNQQFLIASHNTYEKKYVKRLTDALKSCTAIEIDIYDSMVKLAGKGAKVGYWYVRHDPIGTNDNNASKPAEGLKGCLKDLKAWSTRNKGHAAVTVFLDKKQGWGKGRNPADLDRLIVGVMGKSLYRPIDLKGRHRTLRAAAKAGRWPKAVEMRGKFLFVLTGGADIGGHNKTQHDYVKARGAKAAMFVAPDTDEAKDFTGVPNQFSTATAQWVVFYNLNRKHATLATKIDATGGISRVWSTDKKRESGSEFQLMRRFRVHFTAFYKYQLNRPTSIIAYEDDNGWAGHGSSWSIAPGKYSYKGRGGHARLTVPNDEVRAVFVPKGFTVYMTDKDSFKGGGRGTVSINEPALVNIKNRKKGLEGKVSSIHVKQQ